MRFTSLACSAGLSSALLGIAGSATAMTVDENRKIIELSTFAEISEAESVNNAINVMTDAAAACRRTTLRAPQQCECSSASGLASLRSAYANAVNHHPAWASPDSTVWWLDPKSKHGLAVNFSAVARVVEFCGMK